MTDAYRKLHGDAYLEWKSNATDEYIDAQRKAFLSGFEAAASEGQEFRLLRQWLEEQRDDAIEKYEEQGDKMYFAKRMAFVDVLTKLSEMGCMKE